MTFKDIVESSLFRSTKTDDPLLLNDTALSNKFAIICSNLLLIPLIKYFLEPDVFNFMFKLGFKFKYMDDFFSLVNEIRKSKKNLIIAGDYNICHEAIDIHDPIRNAKVSGFLPEERQWLDRFLKSGFTDTFRFLNKDPHQYSWWSYRANSRANNKGWRIDYLLSSENLNKHIKKSYIMNDVYHSDHCPIGVNLEL